MKVQLSLRASAQDDTLDYIWEGIEPGMSPKEMAKIILDVEEKTARHRPHNLLLEMDYKTISLRISVKDDDGTVIDSRLIRPWEKP